MDLEKILLECKNVIVEVGNFIKNTDVKTISEKGDVANIVTDNDVKSQELIINSLKNIIPNAIFFAEEKENNELSDEYTWVIDPIDGTTNYAYNYKHSAISIALIKDKKVILGVCYNPYLDELFYAIKDKGSFLNDKKITVGNKELSHSLVMCGTSPYHKEQAEETFKILKKLYLSAKDIRRSGSAVLDLCYLASGRVDAFYEKRLAFWDYAASSFILKEAGGVFEIFDGNWGSRDSICLIGGNKENIEELKKLVFNDIK